MAYADSSSGDLDIAVSTDGLHFGSPIYRGPYIGVDNTPSITVFGNELVVAYTLNQVIYVTASTNGSYWLAPSAIFSSGSLYNIGRPSILGLGGNFYTAFTATEQASGNTYALIGRSSSLSVGTVYYLSPLTASSNPSLAAFGTGFVMVWTTTSDGFPVVAYVKNPSGGLTAASVTETTGIEIGGDPAPIAYNGGLFIFGRSFYSEDNLWAIGTTNGTSFESQTEYGQTLTNSPGLAIFNGALTQAGRSNYGSNIWVYQTAN